MSIGEPGSNRNILDVSPGAEDKTLKLISPSFIGQCVGCGSTWGERTDGNENTVINLYKKIVLFAKSLDLWSGIEMAVFL